MILKKLDLLKEAVDILVKAVEKEPTHWGGWLELSTVTDRESVGSSSVSFAVELIGTRLKARKSLCLLHISEEIPKSASLRQCWAMNFEGAICIVTDELFGQCT